MGKLFERHVHTHQNTPSGQHLVVEKPLIDIAEFLEAMKMPGRGEEDLPEEEKINNELNRQVGRCTCRKKFKIRRVGENRYSV